MRPTREIAKTGEQTYFVSSQTSGRQPFFRYERWAVLLQEVLQHYRGTAYLLHAYVIMPDHFHALLSPTSSIERAMQNIKGGFSFRAKRGFDSKAEIWQAGFSDHRIRDVADWQSHLSYMQHNPDKMRGSANAADYPCVALNLDPLPQRLKPISLARINGGAEASPLQRSMNRMEN